MPFEIYDTYLDEVKVISPTRFSDPRGYFQPTYRKDEFYDLGLDLNFVQDNISFSDAGVLRGLHYQLGMGKMLSVHSGSVLAVTVDIRRFSPTFGKYHQIELSRENGLQVWAPSDFARGYFVLENKTVVHYKCTDYFDAKFDSAIAWNDPDIGIGWPIAALALSERDRNAPTLKQLLEEGKL